MLGTFVVERNVVIIDSLGSKTSFLLSNTEHPTSVANLRTPCADKRYGPRCREIDGCLNRHFREARTGIHSARVMLRWGVTTAKRNVLESSVFSLTIMHSKRERNAGQ